MVCFPRHFYGLSSIYFQGFLFFYLGFSGLNSAYKLSGFSAAKKINLDWRLEDGERRFNEQDKETDEVKASMSSIQSDVSFIRGFIEGKNSVAKDGEKKRLKLVNKLIIHKGTV